MSCFFENLGIRVGVSHNDRKYPFPFAIFFLLFLKLLNTSLGTFYLKKNLPHIGKSNGINTAAIFFLCCSTNPMEPVRKPKWHSAIPEQSKEPVFLVPDAVPPYFSENF